MIDLITSELFLQTDIPYKSALSKAVISYLAAEADWTYTTNFGGTHYSLQSGMFSGSWTTMKDNTLLSYAYMKVIEELTDQSTNSSNQIVERWLCGDDVDIFFKSVSYANVFLHTAQSYWSINPAK